MGATCLVHWKDANGQQSLTLLSDRLLKQFHASNIGRWNINWKVFRDTSPVSKSGTGKMMHVVHVQGGATARGRAVLVEVEKDIEALIAKLKTLWVHRQHAQVEGYVYDLGDFIVRAGNIMVASTSYKGMLIEIEYLPQTSSATASNALLEEFVRLISPPGVNLYSPQMFDYPYEQVGLDPKNWSMLHSGFQFMTLFRRQHIL
ncbi:MAG: mediator complex, subunit Med20 [Linnemannia elongata]|nr:MAG: mediator complex, subunit Med20 [Linnemannia elongata]